MKATKCTEADLHNALQEINKLYDGNVKFRSMLPGKPLNFTLTVIDCRGPGGRVGQSGRRISAACWHVHGHFFDALFRLAPGAVVRSAGRKITAEAGNWHDWNIGSEYRPFMHSDSCECSGLDTSTRLAILKASAEEHCNTYRGHELGTWDHSVNKESAYTQCVYCNCGVTVNVYPMPNECDMSGDALAIGCTPAREAAHVPAEEEPTRATQMHLGRY